MLVATTQLDRLRVVGATLIVLGSAHPAIDRLGLALVGVVVFGLLAAAAPRRQGPAWPAAALTVLVVIWMFLATLAWGAGHPTLRWDHRLGDTLSTLVLLLAFLGVAALGVALRAAGLRRRKTLVGACAGAVVCFTGWSVFVRYSPIAAAASAAAAVSILLLADRRADASPLIVPNSSAVMRPGSATLVVIAATVVTLAWLGYAVVWILARGENTACGCWADNNHSPVWALQFLLAMAGCAALASAVVLYLHRGKAVAPTLAVAVVAMAGWVLIIAPPA